jgi:signal transduction histidine kinase
LQDHGGQIETRTHHGEGTTFTLTLPAVSGAVRSELCTPMTRQP